MEVSWALELVVKHLAEENLQFLYLQKLSLHLLLISSNLLKPLWRNGITRTQLKNWWRNARGQELHEIKADFQKQGKEEDW
jgi:hypothetical protein